MKDVEEIKYRMNGNKCLTPCPHREHLNNSLIMVNSGACAYCKHCMIKYDNRILCSFVADTKKEEIIGYDNETVMTIKEIEKKLGIKI